MTFRGIRNITIVTCAVAIVSCDQITQTTPKTINGEWKCTENHYETGTQNYYINIDYTDSTKKGIKIQNFNNLTGYCTASLSGSSITIPTQTIDKHVISGGGSVSSDYKTINFTYNDNIYGDKGGTVTSVCTRFQ